MLLLASVVFAQLRQQSELDLLSQMTLLLDQTQKQTRSFIDNALANAQLFSGSNLMDRYVLVEDEAERYDLMQPALLRLFIEYQKAYPEYRELRLLLPDGYEDTRVAQPGLENLTEDEFYTPYFQTLLESGSSNVSTILKNPDDGQTTLLASVPIYRKDMTSTGLDAERTLRGFMVVTAKLNFLESLIKSQRIGKAGYLVAVDRDHRIVFHPDNTMIGLDASDLIQPVTESGATSDDQVRRGATVLTYFRQEAVYVRDIWLHPDLQLLSVLPSTEFEALSRKIAIPIAIISIGATAAISLLLFLLLRSLVVAPVRELRQLAIAIGEGREANLSDRKLNRSDEIGDLARSFHDMHAKLDSSIHELQESHAEIEHLAYRDSLTGLPNRRLFLELVEQGIKRSSRNSLNSAILFLDLDDFKKVNDTLGHEAGDVLLKEVAQRLKHCLRDSDIIIRDSTVIDDESNTGVVARLGGDEFLILINDLHEPTGARFIAERILQTLREPFFLLGQEFIVGTSIGISASPKNGNDVEVLIKCADTAMYEAKRHNKNTYRFYDDDMQSAILERMSIERDLRIAVNDQAFTLNYQPQFDTQTESISGAEVLLRWHHAERGMVPPDQFIPIVEDMGLIGTLGEWIIDETCRQWAEWKNSGIAPPRLALNVSQRQFKLCNLVEVVGEALSRHNVPPEALEIEITESSMMEAPLEVIESLNIIRDMGVRIAMDDFGTGYSSLSALVSLPIDTLKIDRCFITDVGMGKANEKIVSAIISLAHNLNLEVVAEGVETRNEYQYLLKKQCETCQGYLFSKPLPVEQMTELLKVPQQRAS